jgi:pSer/pThr/pTyr-binding forkhead associated (FHA) protein
MNTNLGISQSRLPSKPRKGWKRITQEIDLGTLKSDAIAAQSDSSLLLKTKDRGVFRSFYLQIHNKSDIKGAIPELIPIPDFWMIIGRSPGDSNTCGLGFFLPHESVSRSHCTIMERNGKIIVADLGSSNGTSIIRGSHFIPVSNQATELEEGDFLTIGQIVAAIIVKDHVLAEPES